MTGTAWQSNSCTLNLFWSTDVPVTMSHSPYGWCVGHFILSLPPYHMDLNKRADLVCCYGQGSREKHYYLWSKCVMTLIIFYWLLWDSHWTVSISDKSACYRAQVPSLSLPNPSSSFLKYHFLIYAAHTECMACHVVRLFLLLEIRRMTEHTFPLFLLGLLQYMVFFDT